MIWYRKIKIKVFLYMFRLLLLWYCTKFIFGLISRSEASGLLYGDCRATAAGGEKTFVTDFSASTGGNDFTFGMQLLQYELYLATHFQICRTSTSCLTKSCLFCLWPIFGQIIVWWLSGDGGQAAGGEKL